MYKVMPRRGPEAELPKDGIENEIVFTNDTKKLFVMLNSKWECLTDNPDIADRIANNLFYIVIRE